MFGCTGVPSQKTQSHAQIKTVVLSPLRHRLQQSVDPTDLPREVEGGPPERLMRRDAMVDRRLCGILPRPKNDLNKILLVEAVMRFRTMIHKRYILST